MAESILEKSGIPRPCKYSIIGCLFESELDKLSQHEATCPHRLVHCPDQDCFDKPSEKDVLPHLIKDHFIKHDDNLEESHVDHCLWVVDDDDLRLRTADRTWCPSPWKCHGHTFFSVLMKQRKSELWFGWVYVVGAQEAAEKFVSEIEVHNESRTNSVRFRGPVHPLDVRGEVITQSSSCLVFTDAAVVGMMKEMTREQKGEEDKDRLKYLIAIDYKVMASST